VYYRRLNWEEWRKGLGERIGKGMGGRGIRREE